MAETPRPQTTDTESSFDSLGWHPEELSSPDIELQVIRDLALAAGALRDAARMTKWGYVSDHCANALLEIKKAIVAACGKIQ